MNIYTILYVTYIKALIFGISCFSLGVLITFLVMAIDNYRENKGQVTT